MDHSDELQDERKSKFTNTNDLEQRIVKEKTKNVPARHFSSPYEINPGSVVKRSTFSSIVWSSQSVCWLSQRDIRQRLNLVIVGLSQWMNSSLQSSDHLLDSTERRNRCKSFIWMWSRLDGCGRVSERVDRVCHAALRRDRKSRWRVWWSACCSRETDRRHWSVWTRTSREINRSNPPFHWWHSVIPRRWTVLLTLALESLTRPSDIFLPDSSPSNDTDQQGEAEYDWTHTGGL